MANATRRPGEPSETPRIAVAVMIRDLNARDLNKLNGVLQAGTPGAPNSVRQVWARVRSILFDLNGLTRSRGPGVSKFEGPRILPSQ